MLISAGTFNTSNQSSNFNLTKLGSAVPTDLIPRRYSVLHVAAATVLISHECFCTLLVTIVLAVFIFYRNQPEVKATSRYLSICIFIGCYLLLFGATTHTVTSSLVSDQENTRRSICIIQISSTSVGLDLILSTAIAKTLRIAYIFSHMSKLGMGWSDRMLLCLIILITSGKICLLCLWYGLDPYLLLDREVYIGKKGYYKVTQYCHSQEVGVWLSVVIAYSALLCICLVVLAYKTRKIKRPNFKDTKKLNALTTGVIVTSIMGTAMWGILRLAGLSQGSKIVAALGYTVIPLLCQAFLFLPKIYTPFKRHIKILRPPRVIKSSTVMAENASSQVQYHRMTGN